MKTYYYLGKDNAVLGPENEEKLRELYCSGNITHKTPVCLSGTENWMIYNDILPWYRQSFWLAWEGPTEEETNNKRPEIAPANRQNAQTPRKGNGTSTRSEGLELATLWRIIGTLTCLSWIIIALVWQDDMPVYVVLSAILGSIISLMLCLTLATVVHACAIYIAKRQQPLP